MKFYKKNSEAPINFWSWGWDTAVKEKIKNISAYNKEIKELCRKYALAFFSAGVFSLINFNIGIFMLAFISTFGLLGLYQSYKLILGKYL